MERNESRPMRACGLKLYTRPSQDMLKAGHRHAPMRACGLKLGTASSFRKDNFTVALVTPHAGVWIETWLDEREHFT